MLSDVFSSILQKIFTITGVISNKHAPYDPQQYIQAQNNVHASASGIL